MKNIIVLFSIVLLACNELKEGNVVSKNIEPARDYIYMMPIPHTAVSGKTSRTYYTYIPIMMHDDADYKVYINGLNDEGDQLSEVFYVTESYYQCVNKGDHFIVNDNCSKEANKDIKK